MAYTAKGAITSKKTNCGFIAESQGCLLGQFCDSIPSPAGGALNFLEEMINRLSEGIGQVRVRFDSAWYNHNATDWCDRKTIKFAIGGDINGHMTTVIYAILLSEWEILMQNKSGIWNFRKNHPQST